ncbi:MAG: SOS response-associated peptidase [Nocardiopsis sp. BM-2018]|nr:MAG: SOS response-associated peptidase [Nocardiopsis sp. BM-2018]
MCGRFVASASPQQLAEHFVTRPPEVELVPNHNVAPTHDVFGIVADDDGRRLDVFHWGLIPSWAKDRKVGQRMINARAETLGEKPSFKKLFATRRCIVPMDGFYEWMPATPDGPRTRSGKPAKRPVFVHSPEASPLAVAGLWTAWRDPERDEADDPWLHSLTVVTTAANETMAAVHDRMPVILDADGVARWIDPDETDIEALGELLVPAPPGVVTLYEVSTEVNDVRNRGEHLTRPLA